MFLNVPHRKIGLIEGLFPLGYVHSFGFIMLLETTLKERKRGLSSVFR